MTRGLPVLAGLLLVATLAAEQGAGMRGQRSGGRMTTAVAANPPYDGRHTFTRISYNSGLFGFMANAWNHDYPSADRHIGLILKDITAIPVNTDATQILDLEDPEIFRNPVLMLWEPGYWQISEGAARNLGDYLRKGGFIIFDDFEMDHLSNLQEQFARAVPGAEWVRLDIDHPIFHSFFDMTGVNLPHPDPRVPPPAFYGVHQDNDPAKRLIAVANHNGDVAEYWEWSGTGQFAVDTTNDAYKLGVNYWIYALTH